VSQHLAKLEIELGVALFDRAGGRLVLTSAGRALIPMALEMIDLSDRARSVVMQPSSRPRLVVAGFASAISTVVVPHLSAIRELMDIEIIEAEDGYFDVAGWTEIDKIERLFDLELEDEDYNTIAGLVTSETGHVPKIGDRLTIKGLDIEIRHADQKRITQLRLRKATENLSEPPAKAGGV